ncbi:MAG: metal-dependent hydrolase [Candidatus Omnitrophica bacterium]|nr:metal-dependent hydrolase [Candidatus Omnitrophota bacterium]
MTILSHAAFPSLLFIIAAKLLHIQYFLSDVLILIFFSILPDFDFLFHRFIKKRKYDLNFQHHKWFTHWPITYALLLILLLFFPNLKLFLICYGLFSHLILDTFLSGNGIMWFYPFSKKFFNLFAKELNNYHGQDWFSIYKKKIIWKIDILAFVILLIVLFLI